MGMDRRVKFEKIKNARDLGGLPTVDGRTTRMGLIFRSGHLRDATENDLSMIVGNLNIGLIIDLRTAAVRELKPDRLPAGVEYLFMPILEDEDLTVAPDGNGGRRYIDPSSLDLAEVYANMIKVERCRNNLAKVIKIIMTHDYKKSSLLFHCSGGKDRPGVVSAILLMFLGVSEENMKADYMMTNESKLLTTEDIFQMSAGRNLSQEEKDAYKRLFFANEEFINATINAIRTKYENVGSFIEEGLGIEKKILCTFKNEMRV